MPFTLVEFNILKSKSAKLLKMKFVTIFNTTHSSEIAIIRNLLEEHDIQYMAPDMATDSAAGLAGLGITGMRIQVPEDQQEQALAVLKAHGF